MADRQALIDHLGLFVTDHKKALIEETLNQRTTYISVAIEDVYQSQNASAVLRTSECLGIQDVYVMENWNDYTVNPNVTLGASKWLNIRRYNEENTDNTTACFEHLHNAGYRIVGTSPHPDYPAIEDFDISEPFVLVFGNEIEGLSEKAISLTDEMLRIPIYGFTESYNISVSAAICLYSLVQRIRKERTDWRISEEQKNELRYEWYSRIVKRADLLEKDFLKSNSK